MSSEKIGVLLFGSQAMARVLTFLVARPGEVFTFNGLVDTTGINRESLNRALGRLVLLGLVTRTKERASVRYEIQVRHPVYREMKSICAKLFGIGDLLRTHAQFGTEVAFALVFGSVAAGTDDPASDIDILVIGTPDRLELSAWTRTVSNKLGREVNAIVISDSELGHQLKQHNSFYEGILSGPKIMLRGDESEFPSRIHATL
ncbi:MAG: nucleotidyltransferase domain-containing protein [Candidatus Dormibacteria bacterium]